MKKQIEQPHNWIFYGHCFDGVTFLIDGVNVWAHTWNDMPGQLAEIKDPLYQQSFSFNVYTINAGPQKIIFAAGEFSNTVWGFYVPEK